ncbi:hypothetical protein MSIBF_A2520004 [groundwater metagenome]|uniref:Uncharacterized protein n=1 Tax=groundwater metagenome TaxID=717931 RepID=A0A098EAR7_9ZZZZ
MPVKISKNINKSENLLVIFLWLNSYNLILKPRFNIRKG